MDQETNTSLKTKSSEVELRQVIEQTSLWTG